MWCEQVGTFRNKVADARRAPSYDRLGIMSRAIVAVGSMETSHCEYVVEDVLGQLQIPKLRVTPRLERNIDISDFPAERLRIFCRHTSDVLRARPCQLIDFAYAMKP